ncbi:thioredoxin domain-containing protein [Oceanicaulis alexandrii]|uniref:thioredoxin domain-containing protein n=1 Tax=Oceanicaulis alexandrii TaxID=153233 RepID=UPI0035D08569
MTTFTRRALTLAAATVGAMMLTACSGGDAPDGRSAYERAGDRAEGQVDAPVTIIEYASTSCGGCGAFHEQGKAAIDDGIERGDVRFVFREMLTGQPNLARAGFMLARCAPEDQYLDVIDLLFEQQRALFSAMQQGNAQGQFQTIARTAGFSDEEFRACMTNQDVLEAVEDANLQAVRDGITSTPSFIINGQTLDIQSGAEGQVYAADGEVLVDDEGEIPAQFDRDTWDRIIALFKARAEG